MHDALRAYLTIGRHILLEIQTDHHQIHYSITATSKKIFWTKKMDKTRETFYYSLVLGPNFASHNFHSPWCRGKKDQNPDPEPPHASNRIELKKERKKKRKGRLHKQQKKNMTQHNFKWNRSPSKSQSCYCHTCTMDRPLPVSRAPKETPSEAFNSTAPTHPHPLIKGRRQGGERKNAISLQSFYFPQRIRSDGQSTLHPLGK